MASPANIETMLNGVQDVPLQRVLKSAFRYLLANLRLGRATGSSGQSSSSTAKPAENLSGGYFSGVTPAVANREFAIPHSFGSPPYLLLPVLPLDQIGASLVRLTVSRAADANNVYLQSPETGQTIFFYLEG